MPFPRWHACMQVASGLDPSTVQGRRWALAKATHRCCLPWVLVAMPVNKLVRASGQCQVGTRPADQLGAGKGTRRASWRGGPRAAGWTSPGLCSPKAPLLPCGIELPLDAPAAKLCGTSGGAPASRCPLKAAAMLHRVLLALFIALVASQAAADASSARRSLQAAARRPRPKCSPVFTQIAYPNKTKKRVQLPTCATNATAGAARPTVAAAAAAAAVSSAHPCTVGDATCFCKWKGVLGYFADTDPTVACK